MKFCSKDFFSKCDQIHRKWIWSHLLKKYLIKNVTFCAVLENDLKKVSRMDEFKTYGNAETHNKP